MRQWTSQNSKEEHRELLKILGEKVYFLIKNADLVDGISNHEIAEELKVPTATVSGLTRPLVIKGLVCELRKRKCKITGNTVIAWRAKDVNVDLFGNVVEKDAIEI